MGAESSFVMMPLGEVLQRLAGGFFVIYGISLIVFEVLDWFFNLSLYQRLLGGRGLKPYIAGVVGVWLALGLKLNIIGYLLGVSNKTIDAVQGAGTAELCMVVTGLGIAAGPKLWIVVFQKMGRGAKEIKEVVDEVK